MAYLYHKQSHEMLNLIKSASLYNAAIVRSPGNVPVIQDLKKLCQDVLKLAKAENMDVDLVELAQKV